MRDALWPAEDGNSTHGGEVGAFFAAATPGAGLLPEAVLVAVDDDATPPAIVGFVELTRRRYAEGCSTTPVGFLEGWYVVPEYRRRGVGRALVAASEAWAASLGCKEFASNALADNDMSTKAHTSLGFEEVEVIRCFRKSLT
jgi:GNAT superfamily N-acetyltransferase